MQDAGIGSGAGRLGIAAGAILSSSRHCSTRLTFSTGIMRAMGWPWSLPFSQTYRGKMTI